MAQIMFPTRQAKVSKGSDGGGKTGQLLGAAIGGLAGAAGGPGGAVTGAATGASLGGMIGGAVKPGTAGSVQRPEQERGIQTQGGAVERRLQEIQKNPHFALQQARGALNELPTAIQKEYAPTIEAALAASRKAQQVGVA